jgi:hypothetical protein
MVRESQEEEDALRVIRGASRDGLYGVPGSDGEERRKKGVLEDEGGSTVLHVLARRGMVSAAREALERAPGLLCARGARQARPLCGNRVAPHLPLADPNGFHEARRRAMASVRC